MFLTTTRMLGTSSPYRSNVHVGHKLDPCVFVYNLFFYWYSFHFKKMGVVPVKWSAAHTHGRPCPYTIVSQFR